MTIEWSQISALTVIAAGIAIFAVLVFGLVSVMRRVWHWVAEGPRSEPPAAPVLRPELITADPAVSASDLFAVRSNLSAVVRQLEDLETRLRLNPPKR